MSERTSDTEANGLDPDWGLGAAADPVAFGAALTGLGKRLASEPGLVAGATMRFATGLVEIGAAVAARTVGAKTEGPMPTAESDARFSDPAWEANPAFYGLRQCYLLWGRTMRELAAAAKDDELGGKAEFAVGHGGRRDPRPGRHPLHGRRGDARRVAAAGGHLEADAR
jgi:hypothetical protein